MSHEFVGMADYITIEETDLQQLAAFAKFRELLLHMLAVEQAIFISLMLSSCLFSVTYFISI